MWKRTKKKSSKRKVYVSFASRCLFCYISSQDSHECTSREKFWTPRLRENYFNHSGCQFEEVGRCACNGFSGLCCYLGKSQTNLWHAQILTCMKFKDFLTKNRNKYISGPTQNMILWILWKLPNWVISTKFIWGKKKKKQLSKNKALAPHWEPADLPDVQPSTKGLPAQMWAGKKIAAPTPCYWLVEGPACYTAPLSTNQWLEVGPHDGQPSPLNSSGGGRAMGPLSQSEA